MKKLPAWTHPGVVQMLAVDLVLTAALKSSVLANLCAPAPLPVHRLSDAVDSFSSANQSSHINNWFIVSNVPT